MTLVGHVQSLQEHGRGEAQCDEAGDPKSQLAILKDLDKKHQKKGSPNNYKVAPTSYKKSYKL